VTGGRRSGLCARAPVALNASRSAAAAKRRKQFMERVAVGRGRGKGKRTENSEWRREKEERNGRSHEEPNDVAYWLSRSADERFAAIELMRQINYAYDPLADRIPRLLEVVEGQRG